MATETVINRPAPFVEDIGKRLAEQTLALQGSPVVSTGIAGITQQAGETAEGLKARQDAGSEEHTSELQSRLQLVCRLLLEKKKPRARAVCSVASDLTRDFRLRSRIFWAEENG